MSRRRVNVVDMLQKHRQNFDKPIVLSTGYWALIRPVSASLIIEAQAAVQPPPVPTFFNKDKDRDEENPNDPAYLSALAEVKLKREAYASDALVMFGVHLCTEDGKPAEIPPDSEWMPKLRYMEKRGALDLSQYDLEDPFEREFVFKKFIAVSALDVLLVNSASGVSEEDIAEAINFSS